MNIWRSIALMMGVVAIVSAITCGYFLSGAFNVAATSKHPAIIEKALRRTMEASVRRHARAVRKPQSVDLNDPHLAARAYGHYSAACRTCHGAPGMQADPWVVAYPPAHDLTQARHVDRWSDEELFWIIKHGIKDTGMIALGPTHKDDDLWAIAALVRQLPHMSAEQYRALAGNTATAAGMQRSSDTRTAPHFKRGERNPAPVHPH